MLKQLQLVFALQDFWNSMTAPGQFLLDLDGVSFAI